MYIRKTYDKFYIAHKPCFNTSWRILSIDFKTESECDKKLCEFKKHVEDSRKNPILHPFSIFDFYKKVKKRIKLIS